MALLVNSVVVLLASALFIPAISFAFLIAVGLKKFSRQSAKLSHSSVKNVAILIPAHNEAAVVRTTLKSLFNDGVAAENILVVADNCSDETANVSKSEGVNVIERHEKERRGKGYALAFGIAHLSENPPGHVLILDADCIIQTGTIDSLVRASQGQYVAQSNYLIEAPTEGGLSARISAFFFQIKNEIRSMGLFRLGCSVPLLGSGMLFPWKTINSANFATGNITEDTKIGLDLQLNGEEVRFDPYSKVTSYFPVDAAAKDSQSLRWEQGNLQLALSYVPKLIRAATTRKDPRLLLSAVNLIIPPISLLLMALAILALVSYGWSLATGYSLSRNLSIVSLSCMIISIFCCWLRYGRNQITVTELFIQLPIQVLKKIPHYFRLLKFKNLSWIKTERDHH